MTNVIANNLNTMQKDLESFAAELYKYQETKNHLYDDLRLLNSYWEGPSHDMLVKNYTEDEAYQDALIQDVNRYIERLTEALEKYRKAEADISQIINDLRI